MLMAAKTTDLSVGGARPAAALPPARRQSRTCETAHTVCQETVHCSQAWQQPFWRVGIAALATDHRSVSSLAPPRTQENPNEHIQVERRVLRFRSTRLPVLSSRRIPRLDRPEPTGVEIEWRVSRRACGRKVHSSSKYDDTAGPQGAKGTAGLPRSAHDTDKPNRPDTKGWLDGCVGRFLGLGEVP